MKVKATLKKRPPVAIAVRLVASGMVLVLLIFGIAAAFSAIGPRRAHLFPDLKVGFNIRW